MKTFLRDMATRRYFQSLEKWTPDRDDAHDFGFISKAMKLAHKLRIPDLEVVLSLDDPEPADTTPSRSSCSGYRPPSPALRNDGIAASPSLRAQRTARSSRAAVNI